MKAAIIAGCAALALAGCQTTAPASVDVSVSVPVDARIAAVSKKLADNCALMQIGLAVGEGFNRDARVKQALGYGKIAVDKFCLAPPTDVNSAIIQLAQIALDINEAVQAAKVQ